MNLNANWGLRVREKVYKDLEKFPQKDRRNIIKAIEQLPFNPYLGDIEKMKDEENSWRRRIGAYRIFYEIILQEKVIYVFRVERRTSKTY
jgi:mRNA-degrading endonuclease RelE of RelBE toxin-antitoxin system